jgi:hypothetical protein
VPSGRLKVYFTVDTEVWPGSWQDIDSRFPDAFRRYVYGTTPHGDYALPMTLKILRDHGLLGVFFVEPLFSARFGLAALQEIVGLIDESGQDVQLHLHAEWADEAREPVLPVPATSKRQHLSHYSLKEQASLVRWSCLRLERAGAPYPTAFRAGSFHFNLDTIAALKVAGVDCDSSYNHCTNGPRSGLLTHLPPDTILSAPALIDGISEYPVTVYRDRPGHLRPLQLTACSLAEMVAVLNHAADAGLHSVNIVSHNFELLDRRDFSVDRTVVRRFVGLCRFLERNSARFECATFEQLGTGHAGGQPVPLGGSLVGLGTRLAEQLYRRI